MRRLALVAVFLIGLSAVAHAERLYTARRGDTLSRVARRFQVSIRDLQRANEMGRRTRIREGQELVIPGPDDEPQRRPRPDIRGRVGSMPLALALLSNRPPRRLVRRAGEGPALPTSLLFPSHRGRVGRGFGSGRGGRHLALDIAARTGDRIRAAHAGFVVFSGNLLGYGRTVMIIHRGGAVTLYGHLSRTHVRAGERVARGRVVGRAGSTGNSTGPHLHFALIVDGQPVDPAPLFDPQPSFAGRSVASGASEDAPDDEDTGGDEPDEG